MSKYATDIIKKWPWNVEIEWLNDRGMLLLSGQQVCEIEPEVDCSGGCVAIKVSIFGLNGTSRSTWFKFADYLCDVPRADTRKDHRGPYYFWKGNTSECGWYIAIPANVNPLIDGIERWLDFQPPHEGC